MRIAIYTRISVDRNGLSESPDRQLEDCRKYVEAQGWEIGGEFEDRDVSAFSGVRRPEFERMLKGIDDGIFHGVVVWKLDRFARTRRGLAQLQDRIEDRGIVFRSATEDFDASTSSGQLMLAFLVSQAAAESHNTSLRVARAWKAKAERGEPHPGGHRLFGYSRPKDTGGRRETIPEEAAVAHDVRRRLLRGESINSVAADLNARDIRTSAGNDWANTSLRKSG
jgi:site-specific DNA recombinase